MERLAEEILDVPSFTPTLDAVSLGGIEVGHAAVVAVADDVGARAATRSETDVRDDEPGLAERHVFLDGWCASGSARSAGRVGDPECAEAECGPAALLEKGAAIDPGSIAIGLGSIAIGLAVLR